MTLILISSLILHFVFDILSQTKNEIIYKNDNINTILKHTFLYSIYMTVMLIILLLINCNVSTNICILKLILLFVSIFILHFLVDYLIGKFNTKYIKKHDSFYEKTVMIYVDHLLHTTTLVLILHFIFII